MLNLVVLASGRGSNFLAIHENCKKGRLDASIRLLLSNRFDAPALASAAEEGIHAVAIQPQQFSQQADYEAALLAEIKKVPCDLIVLAGYMKVLGAEFIQNAPAPIVNIHPSLLPAFPGLHAQAQAVAHGVKVSGCTVHFVDEGLDAGPIIAQRTVPVFADDTEESLSQRILKEEHVLYSQVISWLAAGAVQVSGRIVSVDFEGGVVS